MGLRLWIEIGVRFECKILGKAIIFFKSWYLNIEPDTIITPYILQRTTKNNMKENWIKNELSINLNIPDNPNFDNDPAEYNDIDEFTSQWTSGGRGRKGRHGILIWNGNSINNELGNRSEKNSVTREVIKLTLPDMVESDEENAVLIL